MILCLLSVISPLIKLSGTGGNEEEEEDDDDDGDFVVVVVVVVVVDDDDDDSDLKTNLFEDKNVNLLLFLHNNDISLLDIFYIILKIIT